jgi:transcriptional regulator with XRE-family HTH domain
MPIFSEIRKSKGFNIPRLCVAAEISNSTVYRLEHGQPVSLLSAGRACQALGLPIDPEQPVREQFAKYGIVLTQNEKKGGQKIG